jgi:hypothetical protein
MTVKNSGNVGIGTTTPGAKLHVTSSPASGVAPVNAKSTAILESSTDNILEFRNTADN